MAKAEPLPGAVGFTRYADSLGAEIFYISNRSVSEIGPTLANLKACGFTDADSTHLLLKTTASSRIERRAMIE